MAINDTRISHGPTRVSYGQRGLSVSHGHLPTALANRDPPKSTTFNLTSGKMMTVAMARAMAPTAKASGADSKSPRLGLVEGILVACAQIGVSCETIVRVTITHGDIVRVTRLG